MYSEKIHLPRSIRGVRMASGGAPAATRTVPAAAANDTGPAPLSEATLHRIEELLTSLRFQLDDLEHRRRTSLREMQSAAVELAVAAAGQLLIRAIETRDYAVEQVVQAAIDQMGLHRPITVRLHPDDLQLLRERLPHSGAVRLEDQCELRADQTLRRGDCRAESPDGTGVLREAASQLAELRELWLEELDDAQVERRSHDSTGPGIKRFPERRETA